MFPVERGQRVLIVWGVAPTANKLQSIVGDLQKVTGESGKVVLENVERLSMASYPASSFDVVLSGVIFPQTITHSIDLLGGLLRLVKPGGKIIVQEPVLSSLNGPTLKTVENLQSCLKLSGMTNLQEAKPVSVSETEIQKLKEILKVNDNISVVEIHCQKPNFEVGSAVKLSFAKNSAEVKPSSSVAAVWKLDNTVDEDIETIDENELLEEEDLKKPDPASLRVCGTTGKRKACKNCSCGLAEELETEGKAVAAVKESSVKTSACGNCYLGDAFRCASCPYLGMPAFKPGEKIQLTDRQLKADV